MKRTVTLTRDLRLILALLFAICLGGGAPTAGAAFKTVYETDELTNPDGTGQDDVFGRAVAISGNLAIIGNPNDNDFAGSAYIYAFDGTSWNLQASLAPSVGGFFGTSVANSGNIALVGSPSDSTIGLDSGAVYVFTFDGTVWTQQAKLYDPDGGGDLWNFGRSLLLSGNTAVIGAPGFYDTGAVFIFAFNGRTWKEQARLTASDGDNLDQFGATLSRSGNRILVGAYGKNKYTGAAYIFGFDGSSWIEEAEVTSIDIAQNDRFGSSVSISGDLALVGAPEKSQSRGAAYVFAFDGTNWTQQAKLQVPGGFKYDSLGSSVAISGRTALVGARHFLNPGGVYEFTLHQNGWRLGAEFVASDGTAGDSLGASVAISGNTVLAGADDTFDPDRFGTAYFFSLAEQ